MIFQNYSLSRRINSSSGCRGFGRRAASAIAVALLVAISAVVDLSIAGAQPTGAIKKQTSSKKVSKKRSQKHVARTRSEVPARTTASPTETNSAASGASVSPANAPERFVALDSRNVLRVVSRQETVQAIVPRNASMQESLPASSASAVRGTASVDDFPPESNSRAAASDTGSIHTGSIHAGSIHAGPIHTGPIHTGMLATIQPSGALSIPSVPTIRSATSTSARALSRSHSSYELDSVDELVKDPRGSLYRVLPGGERAYLTLDSQLQDHAKELLSKHKVPWGAVVAMEPKSGRVLALAGYSAQEPLGKEFSVRGGMPAASLFKMVTAAAALEQAGVDPQTVIRYRGGDYVLGPRNYQADAKRDTRQMTLELALAKSCNPVFARVANKYLSPAILTRYADHFGFNQPLPFDLAIPASSYQAPENNYEYSRSAAGFGPAETSPVHAAMMAAAIGNEGVMMRPRLIDRVVDPSEVVLYRSRPEVYQRSLAPETSRVLLEMLEVTTISGTGRRQFAKSQKSGTLKGISVAAKTGTLSGKNPKGVFHWLVAVAPSDDPEIAIATVVVDPGNARINGTGLGRMILERYFADRN